MAYPSRAILRRGHACGREVERAGIADRSRGTLPTAAGETAPGVLTLPTGKRVVRLRVYRRAPVPVAGLEGYFARRYRTFCVDPGALRSSVTKRSVLALTRSESFL